MEVSSIKIPVLYYHKIDHPDPRAQEKGLYVSPRTFDRQMNLLKILGFKTIGPDELMGALEVSPSEVSTPGDKKTLPKKPIIITFDDGYQDNYTKALPILKKYGFRATIFVTASHVGKYTALSPDCNEDLPAQILTWEELRALGKEGVTIASHTFSHRRLTRLDEEEIRREFAESKRLLEEGLGHPIHYLSYPFGSFNAKVERLARECGYWAAFSTIPGKLHCSTNLFALKRIRISGHTHLLRFLRRVTFKSYDENGCR